jgi:hypothetical protein
MKGALNNAELTQNAAGQVKVRLSNIICEPGDPEEVQVGWERATQLHGYSHGTACSEPGCQMEGMSRSFEKMRQFTGSQMG